LFFCPPPKPELDSQIETVLPFGSSIIPTGLKIEVPKGYMLEIKNKSGIASKRGLIVGACVVDRGYTGEIFVNLHNITHRNQTLHEGDKMAQAVLSPNPAILVSSPTCSLSCGLHLTMSAIVACTLSNCLSINLHMALTDRMAALSKLTSTRLFS